MFPSFNDYRIFFSLRSATVKKTALRIVVAKHSKKEKAAKKHSTNWFSRDCAHRRMHWPILSISFYILFSVHIFFFSFLLPLSFIYGQTNHMANVQRITLNFFSTLSLFLSSCQKQLHASNVIAFVAVV